MSHITKDLFNLPTNEIIDFLKNVYKNKTLLSKQEKNVLLELEVYDYILFGIIGLLTNDKPRILLGKRQSFDVDIQEWCSEVKIVLADLEQIADDYLEDNFTEFSEEILRNVLLIYPKSTFLES